jgi:hypothetical protein
MINHVFEPGNCFHTLNIGPGMKMKPYKNHILAILDVDYIAYKWFSISTQSWRYVIEHRSILEIKIEKCIEWRQKNEN